MPLRIVVLSLFVILYHAVAASAASPDRGDTVESKAASADLVFVGQITRVVPIAVPADVFNPPWMAVTISVQQTLKGPSVKSFTFCSRHDPNLTTFDEVFFLESSTRSTKWDNVPADYAWVSDLWSNPWAAELNTSPSHLLLNTDLRNGLSRDRILELIRNHCCYGPATRSEAIFNPYRNGIGWPALLYVPLDPPMELIARTWVGSPDAITRWNAARILRHNQSAENVAAMMRIAAVPVNSPEAALAQSMALDALHLWGIPRLPNPLDTAALSCVWHTLESMSIGLCLSAIYFWWPRLSFPSLSWFSLVWRIAVAAMSFGLSWLWIGSYIEGAGFSSGRGEIGVWRGQCFLISRNHMEIKRNEPWHLCGMNELWAIQGYFNFWGHYYRCGIFPGQFGAGIDSGGQEVYPAWTDLEGIALPIWQLLVFVLLGPAIIWTIATIRSLMDTRRRGFPVCMQNDNAA